MKLFSTVLLASFLGFMSITAAFADSHDKAKTEEECKKAGGHWNAEKKVCEAKH